MLFVQNKSKWWLICAIFLFSVVLSQETVISETDVKDQISIAQRDVLATDEEGGFLYTVDSAGDLIAVDLQAQKINRITLGLSGYVQRVRTDLSPDLIFITETFPNKTGKLYVLDKLSVKQGILGGFGVATAGRGRLIPTFNSKTNKIYLASDLDNKILVFDIAGVTSSLQQMPALEPTAEIYLQANPAGAVVDEQLNRIYAFSEIPGTLSIIDGSTDKLIKIMPLHGRPQAISIDQEKNRLFIISRIVDKLFVFDSKKEEFIKELAMPAAGEMVFDKIRKTLYLVSDEEGFLTAIDSNLMSKNIELGEFANYGSSPFYIYSDSFLNRLYVLNAYSGNLFVINSSSGQIVKKIEVGGFPLRIAGWPEGKKIFILRRGSPRLWVFDETNLSIGPFLEEKFQEENGFFSSCQFIRIDSFRNLVYVTNLGNGTVTVIDGKTKKPFKIISVGAGPMGLNFNPQTGKIYTSNREDNSVTIIDGNTYSTKTISVGVGPNAIAINPETNKIYVSQSGDKSVAVIDGKEDKVLKSIPVGVAPQNIQADSVQNKIYVANFGEDTISVIDGETDEVVNTIQVEKAPMRIQIVNEKIFVTTEGNNSLIVIDRNAEKVLAKIKLKAMPNNIIWDKSQDKLLIIHKHQPLVTIIDPQNYEILAEKEFPFFNVLDYFYNKFAIDWDSKFIYFTQSSGNAVHLVKIEGNLSDDSLKLAAVIQNNGKVIWQPDFITSSKIILSVQIVMKWLKENIILLGVAIIIFIAIFTHFFLRRRRHKLQPQN